MNGSASQHGLLWKWQYNVCREWIYFSFTTWFVFTLQILVALVKFFNDASS